MIQVVSRSPHRGRVESIPESELEARLKRACARQDECRAYDRYGECVGEVWQLDGRWVWMMEPTREGTDAD